MRKVEVFVAGCPACDEAVKMVERLKCPACDVSIRDMRDPAVVEDARKLGVRSVPAVAVNGTLLDCCAGGVDESVLRKAGVGRP